jgi:hypothetical protein
VNNLENCAVIIHAWDPYEWAWQPCLKCFDKFFDFSGFGNAYFLTSGKRFHSKNFMIRPYALKLWTDRLRFALLDMPEEYVFYFQEDMWPHRRIDSETWRVIFKGFIENDMNVLRMEKNGPLYKMIPTPIVINGEQMFQLDNMFSDYLISWQPSFWKKSWLLEQLRFSEEAWDMEIEGTKRIRGRDNQVYFYPMDWQYHMIRHGQWVPEHFEEMKLKAGF